MQCWENPEVFLNYGDAFINAIQTGNKKNNKIDNNEALYKQTYKRLGKINSDTQEKLNLSFCFYVTTNQELDLENDYLLTTGGDQSLFKMNYTIATCPFIQREEPATEIITAQLLSDGYVEDYKDLGMVLASVSNGTDFKHLKTKATTNKFYNISYNPAITDEMERSNKLNMYARGSVFWIKNADRKDFEKAFSNLALQNIGYNKIIFKPA